MPSKIDSSYFARSVLLLAMLSIPGTLHAQERTAWTANLGAGLNVPLPPTSGFAHPIGSFTAGIGYRWSTRQAVIAQYYFSGLPFKAPHSDQITSLNPTSELLALTANYRYEVIRSNALRPHIIVGSGWYRRVTTLSVPSAAGAIACSPWTGWWGYLCEGGFVPREKAIAGSTLDAIGFNLGGGLSGRIGRGDRPRWFIEIRYHHAAHSEMATQILPITFGLTW